MALRKILDEACIEQFRKDWDLMTAGDLSKKYKVCETTIHRWSKDYNCTKPKKVIYSESHPLVAIVKITPQTIMDQVSQPDMNKVGIQNIEELKQCNEEFMKVVNDMTMAKREKDALLFSIAEKSMGIFISLQPTSKQYMECMYDFYKLKLYEKRVVISDKEKTEIDAQTLKNLKKKHIQEAMDGIVSALNEVEHRFFESLVNTATIRLLQIRKKESEAMQKRAIEASGQVMPEIIVESNVVNAEIVSS